MTPGLMALRNCEVEEGLLAPLCALAKVRRDDDWVPGEVSVQYTHISIFGFFGKLLMMLFNEIMMYCCTSNKKKIPTKQRGIETCEE